MIYRHTYISFMILTVRKEAGVSAGALYCGLAWECIGFTPRLQQVTWAPPHPM